MYCQTCKYFTHFDNGNYSGDGEYKCTKSVVVRRTKTPLGISEGREGWCDIHVKNSHNDCEDFEVHDRYKTKTGFWKRIFSDPKGYYEVY